MCSYIISAVYICRIIFCLKGFALFYHIKHTYGMHMSLKVHETSPFDYRFKIIKRVLSFL